MLIWFRLVEIKRITDIYIIKWFMSHIRRSFGWQLRVNLFGRIFVCRNCCLKTNVSWGLCTARAMRKGVQPFADTFDSLWNSELGQSQIMVLWPLAYNKRSFRGNYNFSISQMRVSHSSAMNSNFWRLKWLGVGGEHHVLDTAIRVRPWLTWELIFMPVSALESLRKSLRA